MSFSILLKSKSAASLLVISIVLFVTIQSHTSALFFQTIYSAIPTQQGGVTAAGCTTYDPTIRLIAIVCGATSLSDIYKLLNDPSILNKGLNGVWILNSNLRIGRNAALYINSTDTKWLKINSSSADTAYGLQILGNANIDSVRISSWNYSSNNYAQTHADGKVPRAYIRVGPNGTGTTNITNSELSYLGSSFYHRGQGLTYLSGNGNVLRNNTIHHMWYGFYSEEIGNMVIEGNEVYDNIKYGIDPHTGTHDMQIRNNRVHDNGHIGIICSIDCKDITIDGNRVSNNTGTGIMLSINMQHSNIINNIVNNENTGIEISESHNNDIYRNIVRKSNEGIEIHNASSDNNIHSNLVVNSTACGIQINDNNSSRNTIRDNYITNSTAKGLCLFGGASENTVSHNNISLTSLYSIYVKDPITVDNLFKNNTLFNTSSAAIRLIGNSKSVFISNRIYNTAGDEYSLANSSNLILLNTTFSSDTINSTDGINSVTISNVDKRPIKNDRNVANIINSTSVTLSFRLAAGERITLTTVS